MTALPAPLIVIRDRHQARLPLETIAQAVDPAVLLLRDKDMAPADRRALAARLADVVRREGTHLSISRDIDLAAEFCASLHLQSAVMVGAARRHLAPGAMIGVSAHSQDEVAAAAAAGADYATLSLHLSHREQTGMARPWGGRPSARRSSLGYRSWRLAV